jgi:hypothetical protein
MASQKTVYAGAPAFLQKGRYCPSAASLEVQYLRCAACRRNLTYSMYAQIPRDLRRLDLEAFCFAFPNGLFTATSNLTES